MALTLKVSITISLILNLYLSSLQYSNKPANNDLVSFDIDAHLIQPKLDAIKREKLGCIYRSGVSDKSIESCYGQNYSKLENSFVNQYRILV